MNLKRAICICTAIAALLLTHASVQAAAWGFNASGANTAFGWDSGDHFGANAGAFGSPVVDEDGFHFTNFYNDMSFRAEVTGDPLDAVRHASTYVHVNVADAVPAAGAPQNFIIIRESGTYGGNPADLEVQADVLILEDVDFGEYQVSLPTITLLPGNKWMTQYVLTFAEAAANGSFFFNGPFTEFELTITNILHANGSTPGTFIQKDRMDIFFPEPATLAILAFAAPVVLRRRRA